MDPFRLCLSLGPVAVYALLLGAINLSRRPFLVSGNRDSAALGVAVAGLVIVGPMELFLPPGLAVRLGPYIWALMAACYALGLCAALLWLRPRLVIYNISFDELRPVLADLVPQLDARARWAGDSLALPTLGVQLHVEALGWMRNVTLAAVGGEQDHAGWRHLERRLAVALNRLEVDRNPRGLTLVILGSCILGVLAWGIAQNPETAFQALFKIFRL
jgi:hypothetical protein